MFLVVFPDTADFPMSQWNYCHPRDIFHLAMDINQDNSSSRFRYLELQSLSKSNFLNILVLIHVLLLIYNFLLALCHDECLQRSYKITKSSIKLNGENQNNNIHIKLFFSTLTKEIIEIRPKTRGEILCKITILSNLSKNECFLLLQLMLEEPLEC